MMNSGLHIGFSTLFSRWLRLYFNQFSNGNIIYIYIYLNYHLQLMNRDDEMRIYLSNFFFYCSGRIPVWYTLKLAFVAWLVLPQFRGSAFIYNKFVREKIIKRYGLPGQSKSPNSKSKAKAKSKFVDFITPKKVSIHILISSFSLFYLPS